MELNDRGVSVCVVTFDADFLAKQYIRKTQLTWPLLIDRDRALYRAYGMERGSWWNIAGPAAIWAYVKLLLRGRRLAATGSDVRQLGGDVLVDRNGIVRLHHVGSGPADRPTIATLLAAIQE